MAGALRVATSGAVGPRPMRLELAAEGKLDALLVMPILRLVAEGYRQADDQRADRRLPLQCDAGGSAQGAGIEALEVPVGIADVHKPGHARGVDVLEEGQWNEDLRRAQHLERAADRLRIVAQGAQAAGIGNRARGDAHARAQRVVLEAAYVTYAAGVVVLPEGQVVAHVGDDVRGVGSQGICL